MKINNIILSIVLPNFLLIIASSSSWMYVVNAEATVVVDEPDSGHHPSITTTVPPSSVNNQEETQLSPAVVAPGLELATVEVDMTSASAVVHTNLRRQQQEEEPQEEAQQEQRDLQTSKRPSDRGTDERGGSSACVDFKPYLSQNNGVWHDAGGPEFTCEWYEDFDRACNAWGDRYSNFGHTANSACCTCGGGGFKQIQSSQLTNGATTVGNRRVIEQLCIDVRKGNSASGTPLWLWPCNGSPAQLFKYDSRTGYIRSGLDQYKCIVGDDLESIKSTPLVIYDCPDSPANDDDDIDSAFQFVYDRSSKRIWSFDNRFMCIDAATDVVVDGELNLRSAPAIQLWNCHPGDNQRWRWM